MVKVGAKRSVSKIDTDEVPPKKQRVGGVDSATLSQESNIIDARSRELCQPWDILQFFERIRTFSSINWFQKPECMAPMVCAQYGWICTGGNLISCQVCKRQHHFAMAPTLAQSAAQALVDGFVETIKLTGHDPRCPWRGNPCADTFLQLPRDEPLLRDLFKRNYRSYEPDVDGLFTLPRIDENTFRRIADEIPESKENGDVSDAMILSACGWKQRHYASESVNGNSRPSASSMLECRYCNKKIVLSQFEFYRTASIAPSSGVELDDDVVLNHPEDSDSKMSESTTLHSSGFSPAVTSQRAGSQTGENFLEQSLSNDDPQVLAEKLKRIGFESATSPRSQWHSIYPTKALQSVPQFKSQRERTFGTAPMSSFLTSGSWPRNSLLVDSPQMNDPTVPRSSRSRRKKRRRSTTPEPPENRVKRLRPSEEDEKSFAPPPDYESMSQERQGQKRRKPESDGDEEMAENSRQRKRARLSSPEPFTEQSMNVQGSRKRKLSDGDKDQTEEPPPKKRRSVAPAVTTNRYFDPIHEHKAPCPYVTTVNLNGNPVPGWVITVRAIPRNTFAAPVM